MKKLLDTEAVCRKRVWPEPRWPERMERAAGAVFAALRYRSARSAAPISLPACPAGDLTAVAGLSGAISGSLSLCCSFAAAAKLASAMLGVPQPTDQQIRISLGELAYRIAKAIGKDVASLDYECLVASPVIAGQADANSDPPAQSYLIASRFADFPVWIRLSLFDSDF